MKNNGGPAFPGKGVFCETRMYQPGDKIFNPGISIRDYFATSALQLIAQIFLAVKADPGGPEKVAKEAYALADAMLEERKK